VLGREMDAPVADEVREVVGADVSDGDIRIVDVHARRIGCQSYACAVTVVPRNRSLSATAIRERSKCAKRSAIRPSNCITVDN
jgi:hypothetical protein